MVSESRKIWLSKWRKKNRANLKLSRHVRYLKRRSIEIKQSVSWQKRNPEKVKAYQKKWRDSHPEINHARYLAYRAENLEKIRAYDRKRKRKSNHGI